MNPNCPKCGGPVTAGAANCEYCGAGLHEPEPAVAQEAAPASASVQEAGQWLEQLSDQQLQKFQQDFVDIVGAGDQEATEKWIMQWEQWLARMELEMPTPPNDFSKQRFETTLENWRESMAWAWGIHNGTDDDDDDDDDMPWWAWWAIGVGILMLIGALDEC